MKKIFLAFLLLTTICNAQNPEDDIFYFNPIYGTATVNIQETDVDFSSQEVINTVFQDAINMVESSGGGIITIKAGTYYANENIFLKSNVHIKVEAGVTFLLNPPGTLFMAQSETNTPISNFSVIGLGEDNRATGGTDDRFIIKYNTTILGTNANGNTAPKLASFRLGNVLNFKLANITIEDTFSEPSSIALSAEFEYVKVFPSEVKSKLITNVYGSPKKGIIENIHNEDGSYGYGLVQMQAGEDILFRNLSGTGGVTLRFESGLNITQLFRPIGSTPVHTVGGIGLPLTIDNQPKINNAFGRNISCKNGHAAFTISPHTIDQGVVNIKNVKSISCEAAGEIGEGFINNFSREIDAGLNVNAFGITAGSYSSASLVKTVQATFGQFAQIKSKNLRFIPCDLRIDRGTNAPNVGLSVGLGPDFESQIGPSLFPIEYSAFEADPSHGGYVINFDFSTVTSIGFGNNIPSDGVVFGCYNDFETCNTIGTFSTPIFIPNNGCRDTLNPLNPDEGGTLSIAYDFLSLKENILWPNPAKSYVDLKIKNNPSNTIQVYDGLGKLVINLQSNKIGIDGTYRLDLSNLKPSIYFVKINNQFQKLVKQ